MLIKTVIDEYVATLKKEWSHDRTKTVGGSEIGQCARKVFYAKNGTVGEDQSAKYGAALRGNLIEDYVWVPAVRKRFGDKFKFGGSDQKTLVKDYLSATPDGLLIDQPRDLLKDCGVDDMGADCLVIEQKTVDPRVNLDKEKDEHYYQTQIQMGLIRELTEWKPNYALISYVDASFLHEITEFVIPYNDTIYREAHKRAALILNATVASELKPEGYIAGGKDCEWCPFVKQCGVERRSVPENDAVFDNQFLAEITDLCIAYQQAKKTEEESSANVREAQENIKNRLRDKGVKKIPKVVSWTSQKGRVSYDYTALKEAAIKAGVDVEKFSTVGEPTDRLMVTLKTER